MRAEQTSREKHARYSAQIGPKIGDQKTIAARAARAALE
jgi:hypothetical protein